MAKVTMTIAFDEDFVEPVKEAILAAVDRAARDRVGAAERLQREEVLSAAVIAARPEIVVKPKG